MVVWPQRGVRSGWLWCLALLVSTACGSSAVHSSDAGVLTVNEARGAAPRAATGSTVAGLDQLGVDLWHLAAREGAGNVVVSPISIGLAFSMARAGVTANGAGLDAALHFPAAGRDEAFDRLTTGVVTTSVPPSPAPPVVASSPNPHAPPPPPVLAIANALFVQQGTPVGRPFLSTLARYYGAGVRTVDFARPSAREVLNAWVRAQTAGRISKLFDNLDPTTKLVLANAVYLKAAWQDQFSAAATAPRDFTTADGRVVRPPTMRQDELLSYAQGPGWQAVELPYVGGLAMRVLLPDPGHDLAGTLTAATLRALPAKFHDADVNLELPRWRTNTSLNPLGLPGLSTAAAAADFSGIAPGLVISAAIHRAVISVDEQGTEAAAVTGIAFATSGRVARQHVEFTVNRPFAYEIIDTATDAPLFLGTVLDPTQNN